MKPSSLILGATALALWSQAGTAGAYVQARTDNNIPIVWEGTNCIGLTPDAGFDDAQLDSAIALAAIQKAASNWNENIASCSYMTLQIGQPQLGVPVGFNRTGVNVNLVKFIGQDWQHDRGAAAITTVTFSDATGRAFDADVELNAQYFLFAALSDGGGGMQTDIENTLTHEFGHLQGLDHTCDDGQRIDIHGNPPVDDTGVTIPRCCPSNDPICQRNSSAFYLADRPDVIESSMFNFADNGEVKKRSPEPEDIRGLCAIYPLSKKPGSCVPEFNAGDRPEGCEVMPGRAAPGTGAERSAAGSLLLTLGLLAFGLLLARSRKDPGA